MLKALWGRLVYLQAGWQPAWAHMDKPAQRRLATGAQEVILPHNQNKVT